MKMTKNSWMLTSTPIVWWLGKKIGEISTKRQIKADTEVFENLKKLHELKETGVITEEEYNEVKERLKNSCDTVRKRMVQCNEKRKCIGQ